MAASFGLEVLTGNDLETAREIGAKMIGEKLATAETLSKVQDLAKAVVFGVREEGDLNGMMALVPLRLAGLASLSTGTFDAVSPDLDLIARAGEAPACYYAWGIAARTKTAARPMILASVTLHQTLFWDIPTFTRAVTDDGLRLMRSFGYQHVSEADPYLLVAPPPGRPAAVA